MTETYPDDNMLLSLSEDESTGVQYIQTGQSPYVLAYRRMLYRLLRATERANDLRVYERGGLTVGVRGGRCFVGDQPRAVADPGPIGLAADSTTHVYVDTAGTIVSSTSGLPADRSTFVPLAEVITDADSVTQLTDLRGEALLQAQSAALAGISAAASEINQALDGISSDVTAANLSILTGGSQSNADSQHRHLSTNMDVDGPAVITFSNASADAAAGVALDFSMPSVLPDACRLEIDRSTGFLRQAYLGQAYHLMGSTDLQWQHHGALTASASGQLIATTPIAGDVVAVVLSCRLNTESSDSADGISLAAFVNGTALTTTSASLTAADGSGFRSTDQADGVAAVITTSGAEAVSRGDLVTIDLTYTANGTVTQQPTDIGVLVVIKASQPI